MYLTSQQVLAFTEDDLRNFLALAVPEGVYLDYKESLSKTSEKDSKREFLKDVTAFANAAGGQVFLGVKEPTGEVSVDSQIVGLDGGETLAQNIERLASTSIDPRIPGLKIKNIPLANGKSCICIHIPQSLGRPHMVQYEKHRSFYVRHSESSVPMSTHEVRDAVLTSASAEARARDFIKGKLSEPRESLIGGQPAFFLQAMPLIRPESLWDVLSAPYEKVIRGDVRRQRYSHYANLASDVAPRPTIDGLMGRDRRENPLWETETHRTGYVSLFYRGIQVTKVGEQDCYTIHSGTCDIFRAFCELLKEILDVSETDVPYLLTVAYLNAKGTRIYTATQFDRFSEPYPKNEVVWPEHFRGVGEDFMPIAENMCLEMFNAFGFKQIVT
jgi:hypothetical protein